VSSVPGLSVCCLTSEPPWRVASALAQLRDVADEIVVAVDRKVDPSGLRPLLDIADSLVRFDFEGPPEGAQPWLVAQCRHDWVFMMQGEEVPGTALVEALPSLMADDVQQVRIARRWCFPDEWHWLCERPWWPDLQIRLTRRGPLLDFDTCLHGGIRAALPARLIDAPLYHLACLVRDFGARRRRMREYEMLEPGLGAVAGGQIAPTQFAPEHFATRMPAPTPLADVAVIREVLKATAPERDDRIRLPVVGADEIRAAMPRDALEQHGYALAIRVAETDLRSEPGRDTFVLADILNPGRQPLPCEDSYGVQMRIGARLVGTGSPACANWTLTRLPCPIPAGESRLVEVGVRIPAEPGIYTLQLDAVNERTQRWFGAVCQRDMVVASRWGRFAL
jgi:hypothetical protein